MNFTFKIGQKIKEAWPLYKANLGQFLLLVLVTLGVSFLGQGDNDFWSALLTLVSILISCIWIRSILNLIDGKSFNPFSKESFPSLKQYWYFLSTGFLSMIIMGVGFVFLIVPGLYLSGRLAFVTYLALDKNQNAILSIKESWNMTKGCGWKIFGKAFVIGLFIMAGFVALGIGSLITYPVGFIVFGMLYRGFSKFRQENPAPVEVKKEEKKEEPKKEAEVIEVRG